jgi:hypothetical protein
METALFPWLNLRQSLAYLGVIKTPVEVAMPVIDSHEIVAWALIIGGTVYAAVVPHGLATATMAAALAAIAVKSALIGFT